MKNYFLIIVFILTSSILFGQNQKLSAYSENKSTASYRLGNTSVTFWCKEKQGKYGTYTEKKIYSGKIL